MSTPLVVIFITYERTKYALEAIDFACRNLKHTGKISWYVCDDGSKPEHFSAIMAALKEREQHICGYHSERLGYGAGVNKAWRVASQTSPVTLWLEDDWRLKQDFNATPHVETLMNDRQLGMIRLGYLQKEAHGTVRGYNGEIYIDLPLDQYFAFAGHPHLKHDRFMLMFGDYPIGHNPGATELKYEESIRLKDAEGPKILWHMPCHWGAFAHFGAIDSYG